MSAGKDKDFDVYGVIRSEEIRDYYRREDPFGILEKEQLILHSYTSVQQKMDMLQRLSQTGNAEENRCVEEMLAIYKRYTDLIYHPPVRTIFLLEYMEPWLEIGRVNMTCCIEQGLLDVYDTLDEAVEELKSLCTGERAECYGFVNLIQIPQNEKIKEPCAFTLFCIDGKWQIQDIYIEDKELETVGLSEDTICRFGETHLYHPLPFENGSKLKVQLPFMEEPVYGTLDSE